MHSIRPSDPLRRKAKPSSSVIIPAPEHLHGQPRPTRPQRRVVARLPTGILPILDGFPHHTGPTYLRLPIDQLKHGVARKVEKHRSRLTVVERHRVRWKRSIHNRGDKATYATTGGCACPTCAVFSVQCASTVTGWLEGQPRPSSRTLRSRKGLLLVSGSSTPIQGSRRRRN